MTTTLIDYGVGQVYEADPTGNNNSAFQQVELIELRKRCPQYPLPPINKYGVVDTRQNWVPAILDDSPFGSFQIVVSGKDVSYFRGIPASVETLMYTEPFDDAACEIYFPQIGWLQRRGVGDLWWLDTYNIDIYHVHNDGTRGATMFEGLIAGCSPDPKGVGVRVQALGALYQADLTQGPPRYYASDIDIGKRVADLLNTVPSRNYAYCQPRTTGIVTNKRGAWGNRLSGSIQELLADAWTSDLTNQWTVMMNNGRQPVIRLKDRTTRNWTVAFGAPGVQLDLKDDWTLQVNTVYGEGVRPDGGHWRNSKYPGLHADTSPPYPLGSGIYTPGSTHSGWESFTDRMELLGYRMDSVGDTYAYSDEDEVKDVQRRKGIQVDGQVGPQTWAAVFDVGANINPDALLNVYAAPLAVWTKVEPKLYHADGSIAGNNPDFDPHKVRVERYENFGEAVTKKSATRSSWREIQPAVREDPNFVGTFTFDADPEEGSRWFMRAGQNVFVRYLVLDDTKHTAIDAHADSGVLLHISRVTVKPGGTVTGDLSYLPHDLVTLAELQARIRDNTDPARRSSRARRRSQLQQDTKVEWDDESGAGRLPKLALFGGLWTVVRVPAGERGTIVKAEFTVSSPLTEFYAGVFEEAVTANWLVSYVGNPNAGGGWNINPDILADAGLLIAWGSKDQPMGYYPKLKSDIPAPPITGRFIDAASFSYWSQHPPWLWVALFSPNTCFITGRLYPGVEE